MIFEEQSYKILVVSSSDKFNTSLRQLLKENFDHPATFVGSVAAAERSLLEFSYDFVIVNAPLPDSFGSKFAIDVSSGKSTVCLLLAKADVYGDVRDRAARCGVFTLQKPTSIPLLLQGLDWMAAARERLRALEKKSVSIEEKMEEIRLVNRAKWLLIERMKMTEPAAHRFIEKQAMDLCITRREVAQSILSTYE